ncbi:unnamed protein product [Urochloa humidicola]
MVEQEHIHQPLVPTFSMKVPSIMPQPYAIDGREQIGGFASIANPTHVGGHAQLLTPHLAMPKYASTNNVVGYRHQKLKRKTMTTELPGPSNVVLDSTRNVFFNFGNNYQEAQKHIAKKKNTTMTLPLVNENDADDVVERATREIPFFPLSFKHGLPSTGSEFSPHEMSSMFGDGSNVELDLSLKLSSPSDERGLTLDLSLKL